MLNRRERKKALLTNEEDLPLPYSPEDNRRKDGGIHRRQDESGLILGKRHVEYNGKLKGKCHRRKKGKTFVTLSPLRKKKTRRPEGTKTDGYYGFLVGEALTGDCVAISKVPRPGKGRKGRRVLTLDE